MGDVGGAATSPRYTPTEDRGLEEQTERLLDGGDGIAGGSVVSGQCSLEESVPGRGCGGMVEQDLGRFVGGEWGLCPADQPVEMVPGEAANDDGSLWKFARNTGGTVFHCVGTCRMGSDDASVLDPQLRVRGVEKLRVIDASVMPQITSANTNATSLMIGERGAAFVMA